MDDFSGINWAQQVQYPPGMDSMLNQQAQSTFYFQNQNGAQVPIVFQPQYQTRLGPTASNDEGPCGPYWPDGAFIPYRPAAFRHPGFYSAQGSPGLVGQAGTPIGLQRPTLSGPIFSPGVQGQMSVDGSPYNSPPGMVPYSTFGMPNEYPFPAGIPNQTRFQSPLSNGGFQGQQQYGGRRSMQSMLSPGQLRQPNVMVQSPSLQQPQSTNPYERFGKSAYGVQNSPLQVKEETLAWAHRVYVDLLASIHFARRQSHQSRHNSTDRGRAPPPRPGIYPKPPRQPASTFTKPEDQSQTPTPTQTRSSSTSTLQDEQQRKHSSKRRKASHGDDATPIATQFDGTNGKAEKVHWNIPDYNQQSHQNLQQAMRHGNSHLAHHGVHSPVSMSPQRSQTMLDHRGEASVAFEMLNRLCTEGGWTWIDGILLGGCLAYGLGDYNKALHWYSKILKLDSNHVEAISNLAATLLALNRREEAEAYWMQSVKLRPNYFEAVEHLIGLLCGEHRGKEAVTIIEFVERELRCPQAGECFQKDDSSETSSETRSRRSSTMSTSPDLGEFEYDREDSQGIPDRRKKDVAAQPGFGSSGFAIPGSENGRILALIHAKGNMLYSLGDNAGAAKAFEDAALISTGNREQGIQGLIRRILAVVSTDDSPNAIRKFAVQQSNEPILLRPTKALLTARRMFPNHGELPGLKDLPNSASRKAAISTTSNSLLSLAKIFQDGMSSGSGSSRAGVKDILALYYLSLALQPSPSTANNVGILLASVQQIAPGKVELDPHDMVQIQKLGVMPGSGVALALAYYNFGLNIDARHAHLYTNLGSLLKDIGHLQSAITMYEKAVEFDPTFDIALANLANAVKDQGRIADAIGFYRRAVNSSPDFAEAVCGLANALNSVCNWNGRGGILAAEASYDRWHVDEDGKLVDATSINGSSKGWMKRVVEIVEKQLADGEHWGKGILRNETMELLLKDLELADGPNWDAEKRKNMESSLTKWAGQKWEGANIVRVVERATKRLMWRWYQEKYIQKKEFPLTTYARPRLPTTLSVPSAPTVLPFHTFTCPLNAKQVRMISQRNALRLSASTLRSSWLSNTVCPPPPPPVDGVLNIGYVSSDFNNHPLAHLMQSVFGMHDQTRVKAICYATTRSDNSPHRQQIEREAPVFHDAHTWIPEKLISQILADKIHILINLNGYTRGAKNEVFAARPAPIQMSFMGFAGTLGAEWCDYLLADSIAIPQSTLRPWRRNVNLEEQFFDENYGGSGKDEDNWVYSENIVFAKDTFFCCDHRQSAPDAKEKQLSWDEEQDRRWAMRKELFPTVSDDAIILGNFNQLYKVSLRNTTSIFRN
jgi:tetratricopeptide (TPR) repeat protein